MKQRYINPQSVIYDDADSPGGRQNPLLAVLFGLIIFYLVFVKQPKAMPDATPPAYADSLFKTKCDTTAAAGDTLYLYKP